MATATRAALLAGFLAIATGARAELRPPVIRLGPPNLRQGWTANWVCFAPDGRSLLSAGQDDALRRWSMTDGAPLGVVREPVRSTRLRQSGDGRKVVELGLTELVVLDAASGRCLSRFAAGYNDLLAVDAHGERVAVSWYRGVGVLDARTGKKLWTEVWNAPESTFAAAFSADGRTLAWTDPERGVTATELASGKRLWCAGARSKTAGSLAFVPGTGDVIWADHERAVRVSAVGSARRLVHERSPAGHSAARVTTSPDGRLAAVLFPTNRAFLFDLEHGRLLSTVEPRPGGRAFYNDMPSVAFSPDGALLAMADGCASVRLRDVRGGRDLVSANGHTDQVSSIVVDGGAGTLFSVDSRSIGIVWDVSRAAIIRTIEHVADGSLAITRDGGRLAYADDRGALHVEPCRPIGGRSIVLRPRGGSKVLSALEFSRDGRWLASAGAGDRITLRDAATGAREKTLACGTSITRIAFTADGRTLIAGTSEGALLVYDLARGALQLEVASPGDDDQQQVADLRVVDGDRVAWATGAGTVSLADARTGQLLSRRHADGIASAVSPDGETIACAGKRQITLEPLRAAGVIRTLPDDVGDAACLGFTDDGARLVSGGFDGTLSVWPLR